MIISMRVETPEEYAALKHFATCDTHFQEACDALREGATLAASLPFEPCCIGIIFEADSVGEDGHHADTGGSGLRNADPRMN